MNIQEPAWLKRTRPCPFFSQGRCLFADSCNFLHDVKVRNAVFQPPPNARYAKQPSPSEPVLDPPSVVVDSASPPPSPDKLSSPVQDSSRYSGLLSVLSDVIGPPAGPPSQPVPVGLSGSAGSTLPSEPESEPVITVAHVDTRKDGSSCAEPPSIFQPDSEDTLVDPIGYRMGSFLDTGSPLPDGAESADGYITSYLVEDNGAYTIGSDGTDEEDTIHHEDFTVLESNRQSTLSSFTGASLLASPRNSVFGESVVPSADGAVDLLSPVQLSAKLQPFPIPSLASKLRRGESIDSGYADSWVGPLPFPSSPPRSFRSPVVFLSHSRQASYSSPAHGLKQVLHGVGIPHPTIDLTEEIEEAESDDGSEPGSGENENTGYIILKPCDSSPSEERGEDKARDPLHVDINVVTAEKAAAGVHSPRRYSPEHLYPTKEHDPDLCNPHSFISDDLSFKTALSAQPSYDDLSDASKVSPTKQDSLLSYLSGCSTPDTSVLSHYNDAKESLEQSTVGACVSEPPCLIGFGRVTPVDNPVDSTAGILEQPFLPDGVTTEKPHAKEERVSSTLSHEHSRTVSLAGSLRSSPLGSNGQIGSPHSVHGRHRRLPSTVVSPRQHFPDAFRSDDRLPKSTSPVESSRGLSVVDVVESAPADADGDQHNFPSSSQIVSHDSTTDGVVQGTIVAEEESLEADQVNECFDYDYDSLTQRLSFPLPPPFLPAELAGHSTILDEEGSLDASKATIGGGVSDSWIMTQREDVQPIRSDPTERVVRLGQRSRSPGSHPDDTSRRSRAASDLTVKRKSPVTSPQSTPYVLRSPLLLPEQQGRSDSVQSLYDQYFNIDDPDGSLGSSSPAHLGAAPVDMPHVSEEVSQEVQHQPSDPTLRVLQREFSPYSDNKSSDSSRDSPRSDSVLRPLLTGGRSFLSPSLVEQLVPKSNVGQTSARAPTRLQVREAGGTMVPLGFQRRKPRVVAPTQSRAVSQSLQTALPASQLREILRIRTDIAREDLPLECHSAGQAPSATRSPLPRQSTSAPPTGGLKPLRLPSVIDKRSSTLSTHSSSIASSILSLDRSFKSSTPQSPNVSSVTSISHNPLLSPPCDKIPNHIRKRSYSNTPILHTNDACAAPAPQSFLTRHDSRSVSAPVQQSRSWRLSHYRAGSRNYTSADITRRFSRRTSVMSLSYAVDEEEELDKDDSIMTLPIQSDHAEDRTHPPSVPAPPVHAIATPNPTLLFAIASDDVDQVRQVLESGDASPNDSVGPQSALAFTLTNGKLTHKAEIVKALLAYGANPSALRNPSLNPAPRVQGSNDPSALPPETTLEGMDPATRYFVTRADATHTRQTSQLIHRSFFRPLTRVRYDVIGQDWALEQLFRVLSMHSRKLSMAPIVVLLCGPSGHGKSLLARKFGFLLDVPTHTVNMTTLRSTHDIWQSYSMSPYEEPSSCTLAEFLIVNVGKRCVVVLDEIEKVEDQKALWSLLMPWELGRCSLEAGKPHVDAHNVIWLATSNIGHELVFEYHESRAEPEERMSREDYVDLTAMLRPRVSHCLGASLVSRVTAILPFVPFTLDEKKAIAAEAVYAFARDASKTLSPREVESLITKALPTYQPNEGARSLHRAISNTLINMG